MTKAQSGAGAGAGGVGMRKHGRSGCRNGNGKSPKLRHAMKRQAEADERKAKPGIENPKQCVREVFK